MEQHEDPKLVYTDNLLVPPVTERPDMIAKSHQSHMNFESIYASQRKCWWWPELKQEIYEEWKKWEGCLRCKKSKTQASPLYPIDMMAYEIGEYWSTDLFEFRGRDFVLGMDKASQFMFIEEQKNKKTDTVTKSLEKFALMLGLPTVFKSDSGPCF